MSPLYEFLRIFIAVYSVFLICFGTTANLVGIYINAQKELRIVPTFTFYLFSLISDTLSLYFWNINHVFWAFKNFLMEEISVELCFIISFVQTFSSEWSAWILV